MLWGLMGGPLQCRPDVESANIYPSASPPCAASLLQPNLLCCDPNYNHPQMNDMTLDLSQGVSQVQGQGDRLHPDLRGSQPDPYPDRAAAEDKVEVVAEQVVSGDYAAPAKASKEEGKEQGPASPQ